MFEWDLGKNFADALPFHVNDVLLVTHAFNIFLMLTYMHKKYKLILLLLILQLDVPYFQYFALLIYKYGLNKLRHSFRFYVYYFNILICLYFSSCIDCNMPAKVVQREGRIGYLSGENFSPKSSFAIKLLTHVVTAGGTSGFIIEVNRSFDDSTQ